MQAKAHIFWYTGLSGTGKTTLATEAKKYLESFGLNVLLVDGDVVRSKYDTNLGFHREAIKKNNLNIVEICQNNRNDYDTILVPVISPIDKVRKEVRRILAPNFSLVYLSSDIQSLKIRDVKGLYAKADRGELSDLIGYSESNPFDEPEDADLIINTGSMSDLYDSVKKINGFVKKTIVLNRGCSLTEIEKNRD